VLNQVLEIDVLEVKEVCLAIYIRMATDTETNLVIVLEYELILDILKLSATRRENLPVIRNLLLLLIVMLRDRTEQAIE